MGEEDRCTFFTLVCDWKPYLLLCDCEKKRKQMIENDTIVKDENAACA